MLRLLGGIPDPARAVPNGKSAAVITRYLEGGRIPWSPGYSKYKNQLLINTLADASLMQVFREGGRLPEGYGSRLDERVVECPWALSRLRPGTGRIMDAGSVFNHPMFLGQPSLKGRSLLVSSLVLDAVHFQPNVSYLWGDFRERLLMDEAFESIVCISTLEHVGMWPIPSEPFEESLARPQPTKEHGAYRDVLATFRRLLVPGGQLLLTVPFGRYEDHDWLQQFDRKGVQDIIASFGGECRTETYFRLYPEGWQKVSAEDCADCSYYNIVRTPEPAPDFAAAARAVACLEMVKQP